MKSHENANVERSQDDKTDFDFTSLSTFTLCPRKYHYRFNLGRVPKVPQTAPEFGRAIHLALDHWYQAEQDTKEEATEQAVEIFKNAYTEQLDVDNRRTHALGEWIIRNYDTTYRNQPWKVVATEMPFTIPLTDGYNLIGRIDKVIEWNGTIWIVDHKTTSSLGPTYVRMAEPNAQFTGYVWAARQLGHQAVGIIVDAISTASGLLDSSRRSRLTPLLRYDSYRSDEAIDEWYKEFTNNIAELKGCQLAGEWPMHGTFNGACTYYGECPYRRVCQEDSGLRDRLLDLDYNVEFWDPRD